jgi:hypothetical protein
MCPALELFVCDGASALHCALQFGREWRDGCEFFQRVAAVQDHAQNGQVFIDWRFACGEFLFVGVRELFAILLQAVRLVGLKAKRET